MTDRPTASDAERTGMKIPTEDLSNPERRAQIVASLRADLRAAIAVAEADNRARAVRAGRRTPMNLAEFELADAGRADREARAARAKRRQIRRNARAARAAARDDPRPDVVPIDLDALDGNP